MDEKDQQALALFAEGKSTNYVAVHVFGKNWARAKRLKDRYDAEHGVATESEAEPEAEAADIWDVTLKVPRTQAADIFATFSTEEQMDAIANVLQNRLNAALGVE